MYNLSICMLWCAVYCAVCLCVRCIQWILKWVKNSLEYIEKSTKFPLILHYTHTGKANRCLGKVEMTMEMIHIRSMFLFEIHFSRTGRKLKLLRLKNISLFSFFILRVRACVTNESDAVVLLFIFSLDFYCLF